MKPVLKLTEFMLFETKIWMNRFQTLLSVSTCGATPREALDVHRSMVAAGVYPPSNPRHYRALYKALLAAGGPGGRTMAPRRAAAAVGTWHNIACHVVDHRDAFKLSFLELTGII